MNKDQRSDAAKAEVAHGKANPRADPPRRKEPNPLWECLATRVPASSSAAADEVCRKSDGGMATGTGAGPQAIRADLGSGRPLEGEVRSRMEATFGSDFSGVRTHTDARAAEFARSVDARAVTVGDHVAFGEGQYRPGSLAGDALIAHELAHVLQQRGAGARRTGNEGAETSDLEGDADRSAVTAVTSLGRKIGGGLRDLAPSAMPRLRSGFKLQRCEAKKPAKPVTKVVGHGSSDEAVKLARERMNEVIGSLRAPATGELKGATVELHIIPHDKKLTDLPEFAHLKGQTTFDGRKYDELRGVGGTKTGDTIRYAVAEEQLISIPGKPSGYAKGFVAAHETGHIVEQFGMTDEQKKELQAAYDARVKAGGPWLSPAWYTSSGTGEYFAQSTSAYFGRPYSTSEADKKTYTREWLEKNDPEMHKLLGKIYK